MRTSPGFGRRAARSALVVVALVWPAAVRAQSGPDVPDGPPVPVAPAVVTRDAVGRVTMTTRRLPGPIALDGRLDEAFYREVEPVSDFVQQEPFEGRPATEKTEVWVFFDEEAVYVAGRNWESDPSRRVMSDMQRDARNLYNNDHLGVMFDTFYDRRNGYYFYVNAQGGMVDGQIVNEAPSNNWNGLWEAHTAAFEGGWTVEFRFPFRSIRFQEGGGLWGINFRRVVRWRNEASFLTPVPRSYGRRGLIVVSEGGTLAGLEAPAGLRNLDVKPYLLGSNLTDRTVAPAVEADGVVAVGLDAKWGITQSVITDFTVNTDFAQVEDDEAQVNLTRFSLFFPEKREFFLEGQEYFAFGGAGGGGGMGRPSITPLVFYSRRIGIDDENGEAVPIAAGGRLLGRSGPFQVGALHMRARDTGDGGVPATDVSVLRVNRDVLSRSRVGIIATRRADAGGARNYAFGADAEFNLSTEWTAEGYWARTSTPGAADDQASYRGQLQYNADDAGLQVEHLFVGDDFNPEVGFLRRSAFRRSYGQARYSPRPQGLPGIRKLFYEASVDYYESAAGQLESREVQGAFRVELESTDRINVEVSDIHERLDEPFDVTDAISFAPGGYRFRQLSVRYELAPSRPLSGTVGVRRGGLFDGTVTEVSWRGRAELSPRFYAEPSIAFNRVSTSGGHDNANLVGSRVTYTLSPRMFVGALVQYSSGPDTLSTNVRFRWEYQPGSELFVVWSDGRAGLGPGQLARLETRALVVKITRLLRW